MFQSHKNKNKGATLCASSNNVQSQIEKYNT